MDMPVAVVQAAEIEHQNPIRVSAEVPDFSQIIAVLKKAWTVQTVEQLESGAIVVPEDILNQSLAEALPPNGPVKNLKVTALGSQKIRILADTTSVGRVDMVCLVEGFEHDADHSVLKLKALEKSLPDRPLMSFIFSHVSLAMITHMAGNLDVGSGLNLSFYGNEVTIDFHEALQQSPLGQNRVLGRNLLNEVQIQGLEIQPGSFVFQTNLKLPPTLIGLLKNLLAS